MKISFTAMMIAFVATSASAGRMPVEQAGPPPGASELVYDTYCKKEEREKRQLFRAATPAQKVTLVTTQLERWRDANRATVTKDQLATIEELLGMITVKLFEASDEGKTLIAKFEATARKAFSGRQMDEMAPGGPCIAKK
jgi:hypothetical protein